ncbi:MAG: type II toxin-antitoxin system mRNA interferase toxin, RelE/StbE family [Kiloniellales bacterium]|nr:type II toxin-antitoxin system mRNA interferase toxin, RelE/StbE family [Kiloniellales bacterium]
MLKVDFDRSALRFLKRLPAKQSRQIALKVLALCRDPEPQDSRELKGKLKDYRRVDVGEFRVIYFVDGVVLRIPLIGKRNDGEIYRQMRRKVT